MPPLTPHWPQPSHPDLLEVIRSEDPLDFTSKAISLANLAPNSVFAKFEYPPCTNTTVPTYATVHLGNGLHLNINSDMVYINHSCEPTLKFDTKNKIVRVGPKGVKAGQELSFFYPSTEWTMMQGFDCTCGTPSCLGRISGARDINPFVLADYWLNDHIRDLLTERANPTGDIRSAHHPIEEMQPRPTL